MHYKVNGDTILFTINTPTSIQVFLDSLYLSRKTIHLLKQNKEVLLNDVYVSFDTMMQVGDCLKIKAYKQDDGLFQPTYGKLDIAYEDDFILVVNKPAFINVYPDDLSHTDSLCNIVSYYYKKKRLSIAVRYIHRLDYDTSGLVMFVKCQLLQAYFDHMLEEKKIQRLYIAIVEGSIKKGSTKLIKASISNDRHHSNRMRVGKNGKTASTYVKCLESNERYSKLECQLQSGRKHQIRVHLSYIGYPLVGDRLYGLPSKLIGRQALHGYKLSFYHPILQQNMTIVSELPEEMKAII